MVEVNGIMNESGDENLPSHTFHKSKINNYQLDNLS